jgi:hypothetical protein
MVATTAAGIPFSTATNTYLTAYTPPTQ